MLDADLLPEAGPTLTKANAYIEQSQVVTEAAPPLARYYRHISKGAWPFSTRDHGWPISDCTSEGFKAAIALATQVGCGEGWVWPGVGVSVGGLWRGWGRRLWVVLTAVLCHAPKAMSPSIRGVVSGRCGVCVSVQR